MTRGEISDIIRGSAFMKFGERLYELCGITAFCDRTQVEFVFTEVNGNRQRRFMLRQLKYNPMLEAVYE